jgi:hypothetical protein
MNERYAGQDFHFLHFSKIQKLCGTCVTGCPIVNPGPVPDVPVYKDFTSRLIQRAVKKASSGRREDSRTRNES